MRFATHRRLVTWTAIPMLVAQVGCAARGVPVRQSAPPVAVSAADRTACEELLRAEAKAAKAAGKAREKAAERPMSPGEVAGDIVGGTIYLAIMSPLIVVGLVAAPFTLVPELISDARSSARAREAAVSRCLEPVIHAATLGPDHPDVARSLGHLASRYAALGNDTHAEALYLRALAIQEKALGADHPDVANTLDDYVRLLWKTNRNAEADQLETRAKAIRAGQPNGA